MRRAKTTLLTDPKGSPESLAEMTWSDARRQAAGDIRDWTPEEEKRIEKISTALRKAIGDTADRQPDIFRQAFDRFSPQLAKALGEGYVEEYREAYEAS